MSSYDEALFKQQLLAMARDDDTVTREDVAAAFWAAASDLHIDESRRAEAEAAVMADYVPALAAHYLPRLGLALRDW